ncbi:MAG: histidine--tRNA ligase [Treponema sp.]|jgi:histidyl-tRNA synthetase|nr:histidine--tRNA ligase [Treponema sp.]
MAYIEPRVLKGFRDFLPQTEIIRRNLIEKIENVFKSFGFVPIDTPVLEYAEILLGKGGGDTEKQIFRFNDNGGRDVALRFDLTVPFARFTALHRQELAFPFKRYHIAKVWRGENSQRGRYREFTQCDFDIIGSDTSASDFEILLLIYTTLKELGCKASIHVNHRGLFNRFLSHTGQREKSVEILRIVDKLAKAGKEEILKNLEEITGGLNARKILEFISADDSFDQTLDKITELSGGVCDETEQLRNIRKYMLDTTGNDEREPFILDPSITRGLDYYTGVVFETFLTEMPEIGSVCSGGRYDNLAGLYSKDSSISGVGSSIGLDRLLAALESLNKLPAAGAAAVAVACVNPEHTGLYQSLARRFRSKGIPCEVFTEGDEKQLVKQYVLAEKKGMRYVIIPGKKPLDEPVTIRDLSKRQNTVVSIEDAVGKLF